MDARSDRIKKEAAAPADDSSAFAAAPIPPHASTGSFFRRLTLYTRLGGAVGTFVLSLMFDLTGNYSVVWPGCAILMISSLLCILYCLGQAERRKSLAAA